MVYAEYACETKEVEIVAVVEPNEKRRKAAANKLAIGESFCFDNAEDFFKMGKIADALIIASMDRDHFQQTMTAMELGYDILLEKPISPDPKECVTIQDKAEELGRRIVICHVLRYTDFFSTIKEIIDSGEMGKVISIQHNENVGNYHIAHSFVRGNWRRSDLASPLIMQKSCHDMDVLSWLVGSEARRITSFGSLQYFKEENAPKDSGDRCLNCMAAAECRFDARKAYLPVLGSWPTTVITEEQTTESVLEALEESPYGRCVYRCDNDVCDNQVVLIEFKNQVTVSFNLSGFTNRMGRTLKVMCENGEIKGDDSLNRIEVTKFTSNAVEGYEQRVINTAIPNSGHGGGDVGLVRDFLRMLQSGEKKSRSSIEQSVESHVMAYAAEKSRLTGTIIDVDELKVQLRNS
jgi:predicted dehydrogenase